MEKIKVLPWESNLKQIIEENEKLDENIDERNIKKRKKKIRYQGYKEDPFVFLTDDDIVWPEIRYKFIIS